jgi:hypothetical protein
MNGLRSKSPFRAARSRSKSPFASRRERSKSPFFSRRRRSEGSTGQNTDNVLHDSEINIFQQLCLDRHDDCAAIEILLENEATKNEIPELYTASSGSTDRSSHAFSKGSKGTPSSSERKKNFLNRLFKSPRKSTAAQENTHLPSIQNHDRSPTSQDSSDPSDGLNYLPKPPSTIPTTRARRELSAPISMSGRVLSEKFDTHSNMSDLSGTRASTVLKKPTKFNGHESLGNDSIKDIRKALKEMEKQLGKASNNGERISRQKVMRALFTVADSLEDIEEREILRKELVGLMRTEREVLHPPKARPLLVASASDDEKSDITSSDNEENVTRTRDAALKDSNEKENAPFSLFSSMGKMFSVSAEDKMAVNQALDDLLWTEFVASRNTDEETSGRKKSSRSEKRISRERPRHKISVLQGSCREPPQRARSWWRRHPTSDNKSESSDSSASSEEEEEDDENDEDDYDDESMSSEEYQEYLPTSITVRKSQRNLENTLSADKSFDASVSTNPRYRVRMVDTESRMGFETASATSSSIKRG